MIRRLLHPVADADTYRAFLFYAGELVLAVAAFCFLLTGWVVTVCFAITPLVIPLLIGLRYGVWLLAAGEAALARNLLRQEVRAAYPTGSGVWDRSFGALKDGAFWKQQAHLLVYFPLGLVLLCLFTWTFELLTAPVWHRWTGTENVLGFIHADSIVETLPLAALGAVLLVGLAHLLGPLTRLSRRLGTALLSGEGRGVVRSAAERRANWIRALSITALVSTTVVVVLVVIWALTGGGYFWPIWPLLSLLLVVAIPGWIFLVLEHPEPARIALGSRALALQVGFSAILVGFLVAVWAITGSGYFWPGWPALGLALAAAVHAAVVYGRRQHRVERLEATRAGAVDVQEVELRRIERDLHDGAQARLVALGMSLGMAEQKLQTDPEAVGALLAEARQGATEALEELRDLARGIHPPILTDRGLEAAVSALVARSPVPVTVDVDVLVRPSPAVETAAYFTVSEALANAIKHGNVTRVEVTIRIAHDVLVTEISDDGKGGADPDGRGLRGLRQRVEALDGALRVSSPEGGPTTIRAVIPCG
jgi:signal transduction histidine kinase